MDDGHGVADAVRGGRGLVVEVRELVELGLGQEVVVEDGWGEGRVRSGGRDGEEGAEGGAEVVEAAGSFFFFLSSLRGWGVVVVVDIFLWVVDFSWW